jgi:hypothetical protein
LATTNPAADHSFGANEKTSSPIASRRIAIAIILGLTLFSGVVHGYLDGRWSSKTDSISIGGRLQDLPQRSGDWVLSRTSELSEGAAQMLQCYGSEMREYRNEQTDARVNVAVLFGPRGPIAVHTPEICYSSNGTSPTRPRQIESISTVTRRHELWSVQFSRNQEPQPSLEVWYAWTVGARWQASKYPRFWVTENLYKVQVAGPVGSETQRPCREFLEAFLPDLEKIVN